MPKFRKKPVVIEAVQYIDTVPNTAELEKFMGAPINGLDLRYDTKKYKRLLHLKTLESNGETQVAEKGDWIIKGVQGEFYPCKPDVFAKTYEAVESFDEIRDKAFNR